MIEIKEMKKLIVGPVKYDNFGQKIFDREGHLIADIRSWGRIQYMKNPEEKQDDMGEFIAQAINEKLNYGN